MQQDLEKCEDCLAVRYKSDPNCPNCGRPSISPYETNDDTARTSSGTTIDEENGYCRNLDVNKGEGREAKPEGVSVCNPDKSRKFFYTQTPK